MYSVSLIISAVHLSYILFFFTGSWSFLLYPSKCRLIFFFSIPIFSFLALSQCLSECYFFLEMYPMHESLMQELRGGQAASVGFFFLFFLFFFFAYSEWRVNWLLVLFSAFKCQECLIWSSLHMLRRKLETIKDWMLRVFISDLSLSCYLFLHVYKWVWLQPGGYHCAEWDITSLKRW